MILIVGMQLPLRRWADYDIFWHLSNGRLMVRDGVSPSPDQFSWSGAGREVALHYVQADRILYHLWSWNGPAGLSLFSAILFLGALLPFALLIGRLGLKPAYEALAILLLSIAFLPYIGTRPHMLGVWMLGILALVLELPFGAKRAVTAGMALACWVNVHGSFPIGYAYVGLAVAIWAYRRDLRSTALAGVALLIGILGAAASPVGLGALYFRVGGTSHPAMSSINSDWTGLRPFSLTFAPMALLVMVAIAVGVWHGLDHRTLLAVLLVLATIQYARFTVFAAPILLLEILDRLLERTRVIAIDPGSTMAQTVRRPAVEMFAWGIVATGLVYTTFVAPSSAIEQETMYPVPVAAVEQLLTCGAPAPVWNEYNWGGYITWKTDGQFLTSIDSRTTPMLDDLFPAEVFSNSLKVTQARMGWEQIVQESPAHYALLPVGSAPVGTLPGWHLTFADDVAMLSVRDGATWNC